MNSTRPYLFGLTLSALLSFLVIGSSKAAESDGQGSVPRDIQAIMNEKAYDGATWGLQVVDLETGQTLINFNPSHEFYIASVRKNFTVGELMNVIGPAHTYDTPVYRRGAVSQDGVLQGDLILVASGDLTMGGRTNPDGTIAISDYDHNEANGLGNAELTKPDPIAGYEDLAGRIAAYGIREIGGDVIIDDRLFQPYLFREEFELRPIFVNDDCVDCIMTPPPNPKVGDPVPFDYRPKSAALTVASDVEMSKEGTDILIRSGDIVKSPFIPDCTDTGCTGKMTGELPIGFVPPLTEKYPLIRIFRIVQPADYARTVLIEQLREAGVKVDAPTFEQNPVQLLPQKDSYKPQNLVAALPGLPYSEDAKFVMKISYNIGADTDLLLFGITQGVDNMDAALSVERNNLQANYGIDPSEYHFIDGSGDGATKAFSGAVTKFLREMSTRPSFPAYLASFPILAEDGSLAFVKRFLDVPSLAGAKGNVHAKTGTFLDLLPTNDGLILKSQALGGYVFTESGRTLVFQLVVNDVTIENPNNPLPTILKAFQDVGEISAILWRDY
jgi:D-alanyl-D-alanine carboxypeptidase/D-alanyl-D-alanine-endopeptidase (penicillin-binding protein 4)